MPSLTPHQVRAARGLLGWTRDTLAKRARVNRGTLRFFEMGERRCRSDTLDAIEKALVEGGVEFIEGGVQPKK